MDQLKPILALLKKHHFWIVCSLIVLVYFTTWFLSTSAMTTQAETLAGKINTSFSTGERIARIQNHPNPSSAEMMKRLIEAEAEQVQLAWERRFREQENVLRWPQELLPDFIAAVEPLKPIELKVAFPTPANQELKREFRNRYSDYIQKELPKLAEIIGSQWSATGSTMGGGSTGTPGGGLLGTGDGLQGGPGMTGTPGMTGMPGMAGMSGMPGMAGMPGGMGAGTGSGMMPGMGTGFGSAQGTAGEESRIVVNWSPANQAALQAASFNWTRPTTLQILYAQEDLWVLRALMLVIKATNGDADAQYNAAIKDINSIELGASAAGIKAVGQVSGSTETAGGGMGGLMAGGMSSMMGSMASAMGSAMGTAVGGAPGSGASDSTDSLGETSRVPDPADGRYVDDKNEPLTGSQLRTAMESNQPGDAFLAVAKRMPVRMRVRMDVRKLPLFLCECANSNLPVEIRQVRINAPAGTGGRGMAGAGGGGMTGAGGGGMTGMPGMAGMPGGMAGMMGPGGMAGMMGPGGGGATGLGGGATPGMTPGMGPGAGGVMGGGMMGGLGAGSGAGGVTDSPYDATVEVYGVIYIFNPVNPEKLGIGPEDINTETDGDAKQAAPPEGQVDQTPDEEPGDEETVFEDPEGQVDQSPDEEPGDEETVFEDPDATAPGDENADADDETDVMDAGELSPPDQDSADGETSQDEL